MRAQFSQGSAGSGLTPSLPDGSKGPFRHGNSGELIVSELHSPGFVKNLRGRTWCVSWTTNNPFDFSTGTYTAGLWNLKGSKVVAVPLKFSSAWTTLTGGASNNEVSCLGYAVCKSAGNQLSGGDTIMSQFTAIPPNDAFIRGGYPSPVQVNSAKCAVINGNSGLGSFAHGTVSVIGGINPSYVNCAGSALAENKFATSFNDFRGEIIVGPDNAIFFGSISGINAHLTHSFVMIWAEVPQ